MRPTQDFTSRNLLWMRSRGGLRFAATKPKDREDWKAFALRLENEIATDTFKLKGFHSLTIAGKRALTTRDVSTVLALRKINDNVRRAYSIRETQRKHAIQLAIRAISEPVSKGLIRIDLRACFESIKPQTIMELLRKDALVSHQTLALIESLFRTSRRHGSRRYASGLARGLLTSSSFAELALRPIDSAVSALPGVYLVIRYVDDLLIFTTTNPDRLFPAIEEIVKANAFSINATKTDMAVAGCECALHCVHHYNACPCEHGDACVCDDNKGNFKKVEYLGYKLAFRTGKNFGDKKVHCLLSDKKIERLKARIALAVKDYRHLPDSALLESRLAFLTGNIVLGRTERGNRLLSGLAFSHPAYSGCPEGYFDENKLEHLDNFMRASLRRAFRGNTPPTLRRVWKYAFVAGFNSQRQVKFTPAQMKAIRSCWKHA